MTQTRPTDDPDDDCRSRRSVLRGTGALAAASLAGFGGTAAATSPSPTAPPDARPRPVEAADRRPAEGRRRTGEPPLSLRVLTRNCYLGADLSRLFTAESTDEIPGIVGGLLADIDASHPPARMDAVAGEIAATDPDLVGLQEVGTVRTERPSDSTDGTADAETVRYDFLADLRAALDERGAPYRVAAAAINADAEFPADVDGERLDVRLTDRDVVLAHERVETANPRTGTYETNLTVPISEERAVEVTRGYAMVDTTVPAATGDGGAGDPAVTFATTHLESTSPFTREEQARELDALLDPLDPVVLVGDLNSVPDGENDVAYRVLTDGDAESNGDGDGEGGGDGARDPDGGLADAVAVARPDASVPTCCQLPKLVYPKSRLDRRVDHVLARDLASAGSVTRVGATEDVRITVDADGGDRTLWPSDHAGVAVTLGLRPAAEASATTAPETTATARPATTAGNAAAPAAGNATETATAAANATSPAAANATSPAAANASAPTTDPEGANAADATTGTAAPGFGAGLGALGAGALALFGALRSRRDE